MSIVSVFLSLCLAISLSLIESKKRDANNREGKKKREWGRGTSEMEEKISDTQLKRKIE